MSSTPLPPREHQKNENRRVYARRRIDQLTYATFGPGNGGILLNLSEGGVSFQGIGTVRGDQLLRLSFKLPGMSAPIEASGEVVWSNNSGKGGGLRFLDLTEDARQRMKEWLANDADPATNFIQQETPHSGDASTLGTLAKSVAPSLPAIAEQKEHPETAPIVHEEKTSKPPHILLPGPVKPNASPGAVAPAGSPPSMLSQYPETKVRKSPSPQFVVFATGVLAGCVGVLAAIAGVRMLVNPGRSAIPEIAQSPAALHMADAGKQNSPVNDGAPNEGQSALSDKSVEAAPAANDVSLNQTPGTELERVQPVTRAHVSTVLRQVFRQSSEQKTNLTDIPQLALLAPRLPAPRSKPELRELPTGESTPPAIISTEGPRPVAPSMLSDQPKPPKPSAEKTDRTTGFFAAVLIQHNPPIYPPRAMKKHIEGLVTVNATIGIDGVPREIKLVSGDPSLAPAAQEAITHWRYVPAVSGGVPVESQVAITINFQSKP